MKAVIIGGAGFIGSHVVDQVLNSDIMWDEVLVIDNLSTGFMSNLEDANGFKKRLVFANCDIRNLESLTMLLRGATHVWHLAALPRVEPSIVDPVGSNDINATGTLNVFQACRVNNVKRLVFSSSSSVYGEPLCHPTPEDAPLNPMSPYALQKLHGEQYAKMFCDLYGMSICCLRYFNVYGPREPKIGSYVPVIGIWLRQLREGKKLTITGTGKQTRDFVDVRNVAAANYAAQFLAPNGYSVYNVGSGNNYELNTVARWICPDESNIQYIEARSEPQTTLADITKLMKMAKGTIPAPLLLEEYIKEELAKTC